MGESDALVLQWPCQPINPIKIKHLKTSRQVMAVKVSVIGQVTLSDNGQGFAAGYGLLLWSRRCQPHGASLM